jgi:predicted DNA-binding transcriptional regulator AlpA|tara:strand:+ start:56 stop:286 length:231 start_codon:yes stop_codon:yes gene_type:complete
MSYIHFPKLEEDKKKRLPKLMSRKDVMEHFGISKTTLWRWSNVDEKLKSFSIGRRKWYKQSDVDNLIEEHYSLSNS